MLGQQYVTDLILSTYLERELKYLHIHKKYTTLGSLFIKYRGVQNAPTILECVSRKSPLFLISPYMCQFQIYAHMDIFCMNSLFNQVKIYNSSFHTLVCDFYTVWHYPSHTTPHSLKLPVMFSDLCNNFACWYFF